MLKRAGDELLHHVADSEQRLDDKQFAAYNAAFQTIEGDLSGVKRAREELNRLEQVNLDKPIPKAFDTLATPEGEWNAHAQLFKSIRSEIFLCRQAGGDQWAVIQRFQHNSPYAQAHGDTDILLKGNDVRELMTEYMAQMRHTVRFMARNAEVKAQKIIWEQAPDDPGKVVRAIFERCNAVAENTQALKQSQVHAVRQSRGVGI
jgi:hypothetical protein